MSNIVYKKRSPYHLALRIKDLKDNKGLTIIQAAKVLNISVVIAHDYYHVMQLNDTSKSLIRSNVVSMDAVVFLLSKNEYNYEKGNEILLELSICYDKITRKRIAEKLFGLTTSEDISTETLVDEWRKKLNVTEQNKKITIQMSKKDWDDFNKQLDIRILFKRS